MADAILAPYMPVVLNLCEEILWLTVDVVLLILSLIPKIGTLIKGTAKYAMNAMKTVKTATKFTKIANAANKIRKYAAITIKATDKFFRVTKTGRIITKTAKYAKKIRDVINGTV